MTRATTSRQGRLTELDGARGIAVLLVVFWHYFALHIGSAPPGTVSFYFARGLSVSAAMMDMFFVVSGYLIGGIIIDHKRSPNLFRVFYLRRALRILPAYLLLLAASLMLRLSSEAARQPDLPFFEGTIPWWSYLTFTQNFFQLARTAPGPLEISQTWTVALEEQFYALMPLLIYLVPERRLPIALVAVGVASLALRISLPSVGLLAQTIVGRADPFCLGVLLAIAARSPAVVARFSAHPPHVHPLKQALCVLVAATIARSFRAALGGWVYCLWALTWAATIVLVLVEPRAPLARVLRWRVLVWFGEISYGLYLYHWIVRSALMVLIRGTKAEVFDAATTMTLLLAFALSVSLAAFSYFGLERRLVAWGHSFRYASPDSTDAPAQASHLVRPTSVGRAGSR